jgi:hypothetical protein
MQENDFEVVSCPCTDNRITLPHLTIRTKHKLSTVEKRGERIKNNLEDLPYNMSIMAVLIIHGGYFVMSFIVIFGRNGKKGNKDACKI